MRQFEIIMKPDSSTNILDIGGTEGNWKYLSSKPNITLLNINEKQNKIYPNNIKFINANALDIPFPDNHFDIAFSNSVIEHVHTFDNQIRFANEALRVAKRVWVQTPAREFIIEPHYITPVIHWLPKALQIKVLRNFSIWGWINRPTKDEVKKIIEEIRLMSKDEVIKIFPGCDIKTEKLFGLTKSYIVIRK